MERPTSQWCLWACGNLPWRTCSTINGSLQSLDVGLGRCAVASAREVYGPVRWWWETLAKGCVADLKTHSPGKPAGVPYGRQSSSSNGPTGQLEHPIHPVQLRAAFLANHQREQSEPAIGPEDAEAVFAAVGETRCLWIGLSL